MTNKNEIYKKRLLELQKELTILRKKEDKTKADQDKINIISDLNTSFADLIKMNNELDNAKNEGTDTKELKKNISKKKGELYKSKGFSTVFSCLFGQINRRIGNFLNKSELIYKLRKLIFNSRYEHPIKTGAIKTVLSLVILWINTPVATIIGAGCFGVTVYHTIEALLKNEIPNFERKRKILRGSYVENLTNAIYGYERCRGLFNGVTNEYEQQKNKTEAKTETIHNDTVKENVKEKNNTSNSNGKNADKKTSVETKQEVVTNPKVLQLINKINMIDLGLIDLNLVKECLKEYKELNENLRKNVTNENKLMVAALHITAQEDEKVEMPEVKETEEEKKDEIKTDSEKMYDKLQLKAKLFDVVDENQNIVRTIINCRFFLGKNKINQVNISLNDICKTKNYNDIIKGLKNAFPYLKTEPELTFSKANIVKNEKLKGNSR